MRSCVSRASWCPPVQVARRFLWESSTGNPGCAPPHGQCDEHTVRRRRGSSTATTVVLRGPRQVKKLQKPSRMTWEFSMIHQFPSELYDSNINSSEKIYPFYFAICWISRSLQARRMQRICLKLQDFFRHLTPKQGAPSSPPGRNTSRLALPKSEWQLQIRIWAHHLKYKLRLEAQEIREKNLTRQLAAKGAVSINALARKVAVDEALIGYTSRWPSFKIHCDHGLVQEFQKNPGAHSLPLANTITNNISIHSNLTCHSISFNQSMTYLINCQW